MDNEILQLIKIISALYFENLADDKNPNLDEELRRALLNIKVDNAGTSGLGSEDAAIESLRYTAEWMINNPTDEFTIGNIKQRLRINLQGNNNYIDEMDTILSETVAPIDARRRVNEIMSEIRFNEKRGKLKTLLSKANAKINFSGEYVENKDFITEVMGELDELHSTGEGDINGFVGSVDFTDAESIRAAMRKGTEALSPEGLLNTGLQGLNRAFGMNGIPRGAMCNFAGLTHHYKSGMLIDLALNIPVYNEPYMWDDTKKPLILRISFENTVEQDIQIMFKKLYEIRNQNKIASADINIDKASEALMRHFASTGYNFMLESYNPNNFTIYDLFDIFDRYEEMGYEIHAVSCDYLAQIAHNTIGDRPDSKIQKTFEMARNFCYPKGITFLTGHQLSTEAQAIARESTLSFARKVSSGGYYMDCKSLHTKLDLEVILCKHIHVDGHTYLNMARGKNRYSSDTPESHKTCSYQFQEFGGIVPDVDKDATYLEKPPNVMEEGSVGSWD